MRKNKYKKRSVKIDTKARSRLDTETVLHAISGDPVALMQIVEIYEPYINKLSKRSTIDENGFYSEYVDETVKRPLETSLIAAIMKFDPYRTNGET